MRRWFWLWALLSVVAGCVCRPETGHLRLATFYIHAANPDDRYDQLAATAIRNACPWNLFQVADTPDGADVDVAVRGKLAKTPPKSAESAISLAIVDPKTSEVYRGEWTFDANQASEPEAWVVQVKFYAKGK